MPPAGAARRNRTSSSKASPPCCSMPVDKVHVIFKSGPGSYGRNDADDCAMDAAVLAQAVGRPVRLQYMRDQGTGWDPKGPASTHQGEAPASTPPAR